ncbi:MAG: PepSY domain-containing protein [Pseudomonadota bacterium]|nr:PepSY domain-containing protein [Pseudomonadota bacterium]
MTPSRSFFPLAGMLMLLAMPWQFLQADQDADRARMLKQRGDILPLEQVIESAMAVKPGQILETELDEDDGRYVYELEILDDRGQVWELELDASTAELLELESED